MKVKDRKIFAFWAVFCVFCVFLIFFGLLLALGISMTGFSIFDGARERVFGTGEESVMMAPENTEAIAVWAYPDGVSIPYRDENNAVIAGSVAHIGVVAYHSTGIDRVELALMGLALLGQLGRRRRILRLASLNLSLI
jgi:hypothetical protein